MLMHFCFAPLLPSMSLIAAHIQHSQVRNYEVYRLLEESLKAMLTSLPLVQVRKGGGGGTSQALLLSTQRWC